MLKKNFFENLRNRNDFKLKLSITLTVIFIDQITKILIRNFIDEGDTWPANFNLLYISHIENTGAAFGIFQGYTNLLTIITFLTLLGILYFMLKISFTSHWQNLGLTFILGGAIGNFLDRLIFKIDSVFHSSFGFIIIFFPFTLT